MKFDNNTREQIVAALDQLGPMENDPLVEKAIQHLVHILANQEDWRPEHWSITDY
jgi:hypothetical protein